VLSGRLAEAIVPRWGGTSDDQAASTTPSMLKVSEALQPSEEPPGVAILILKGDFAVES
jgi:hypothetical protein